MAPTPSPTPTPSPSKIQPPPRVKGDYFTNELNGTSADAGNPADGLTKKVFSGVPVPNQGMAFIPKPGIEAPIPGYTRPSDVGRAGAPVAGDPNNPFYNMWTSKADASDLFTDLPDWQRNMFQGMADAKGGNTTAESVYKKYVTKSASRSKSGVVATPGELAYQDINDGKSPYVEPGTMGPAAGPGGGSRAYSGPVSTVTVLNDEDVLRLANDQAQTLIGRDVTDAEFKKILSRVRAAEKRNPSVSGGSGANRTNVSGLSAEMRSQIIQESTANLIAKDVNLAEEAKAYGTVRSTLDDLRAWSRNNGVQLTDNMLQRYTQDIVRGDRTVDDVKGDLRRTYVAGSYPGWADRINAGEDIADIAEPYRASAQRILEREDLTIDDPAIRQVMQYVAPDGKPAVMPMYEAEKMFRKDPRWQLTNNAQADYAKVAYDVLNMFGLR